MLNDINLFNVGLYSCPCPSYSEHYILKIILASSLPFFLSYAGKDCVYFIDCIKNRYELRLSKQVFYIKSLKKNYIKINKGTPNMDLIYKGPRMNPSF